MKKIKVTKKVVKKVPKNKDYKDKMGMKMVMKKCK